MGLHPGMVLARAQAMVPALSIHDADPAGDVAALRRLAGWCLRYTPLVSADPPDGVWLDVTGCAHLHGGETALLRDLVRRLASQGLTARAAVADTPGAAHAMARFGGKDIASVALDGQRAALADLPIAALRLAPDTEAGLRLLGFERVGALAATARAPLVRRFGAEVTRRLDQAAGAVFEPIVPEVPASLIQVRLGFVEPLLTAEAFSRVIAQLVPSVCGALEKAGQGARRLDLLFERVDGSVPAIRIGTARPSRDARHLARMLDERLERIDPGLGVAAMWLVVLQADPLAYAQGTVRLSADDGPTPDIAALVDRLDNRLGRGQVYRAAPVESDVPERSVQRVPALTPPVRSGWLGGLPRPVRKRPVITALLCSGRVW